MRITRCGRRQWVSALLIIIGALALWGLYTIHIFWLLHEMDAFFHEVVLGGLAFYGFYFGIFTLFLESRNSISRAFGRLHNVLSLCIFVYLLFDTYNVFYARFYRMIDVYFSRDEFGEDTDTIVYHLSTVRYLASFCVTVAIVQGYLVYARIVNITIERSR